ncbi:MAG TPA: hypothetical protein VFC19_24345 [Candidatus Limnocylindrales bacterium]|nr:hypothetical protein [Candidatus Limnocylindrales bacterium]
MPHTLLGKHAQKERFWQKPAAILIAVTTMFLSLAGLTGILVYEKYWGIKPEDIFTAPGRSPILLDTEILWGPTEIRVEKQMAVELDQAGGPLTEGKPGGGTAKDAQDLYMWSGIEVSSAHGIFVWTDAQRAPSMRDCAISLATQGTGSYVPIKDGMRLCVGTNEDRVAYVVIKKRDGDAWLVDGTVWKQRLS